ncbi:hypothetical protein ACNI3K_01840 [Demequina sp. SO4-13]|uniref:hypothetical protein n=1 Tax=Demequina sp. SO4-13 TaxID=3401027 RepID=UPI003AF7F067
MTAAIVWTVANFPDDRNWPVGLAYVALAVALIGLALSFAEERWAQAGAKASQVIFSAFVLLMYVDMIRDAETPLWVPFAFYGSLAVIVGATIAGKGENYRAAKTGEIR